MRYRFLLGAVIGIGVLRILLTYPVFCQTSDEPVHIASGMEWLDRGTYVTDLEHPPLARIAAALGPFLAGIRSVNSGNFVVDGNVVLHGRGRYLRNLSLARAGVLPFFVLAVLFVAAWARRLGGDAAGLAAAALFSNEPNVLAHAGLATTDMAAVTGTIAVAYLFHERVMKGAAGSAVLHGVLFGGVVGLALLTKFSTWLFLPVVLLVLLILHRRIPQRFATIVVLSSVAALLVIWAGYRFSTGRTSLLGSQHAASMEGPAQIIPAPELVGGIITVRNHARRGHPAYLFGQFSNDGWWYYFPVAVGLKTTLGFLALLIVAVAFARRRPDLRAPLAAGFAVLAVSMPVTINIGVRHVLPVYPFFAIAAGTSLVLLVERGRRGVAIVLGALALIPSLAAHPDYIPYFNALAPHPPDRALMDSNLDWGQDLLRLKQELKRRRIDVVGLAYNGTAEPHRHGFPTIANVDQGRYTPGWIAISETLMHTTTGQYNWLDLFKPVARVGTSFRLYHLPALVDLASGDPIRREMSGILLPVWLERSSGPSTWTCDLVISNTAAAPVVLRSTPNRGGPVVVTIPPETSLFNPVLPLSNAQSGVLLYVRTEDASSLHFGLTLRDPAGRVISIPVIRDHDSFSSTLRFPSVRTEQGSRVTLRVYDLTGASTEAIVSVDDSVSAPVTMTRRHAADEGLTLANRTLDSIFPDIRSPVVAVSVDVRSRAAWAFITVTDTHGTHIVLPD